jgi:putative exporter of polyketide antibiotics
MQALRKGVQFLLYYCDQEASKFLIGEINYCKTIHFLFSLDVALDIYNGHLIGWSSPLFLSILLYCVIFKQIQKLKNPILSRTSNRKIVKRGKIDTLTHKYMTAHFPWLIQLLYLKVARLN